MSWKVSCTVGTDVYILYNIYDRLTLWQCPPSFILLYNYSIINEYNLKCGELVHIQAHSAHKALWDRSPQVTNVQLTMFSKGHTAAPHWWACEAGSNVRKRDENRGKAEGAGGCLSECVYAYMFIQSSDHTWTLILLYCADIAHL